VNKIYSSKTTTTKKKLKVQSKKFPFIQNGNFSFVFDTLLTPFMEKSFILFLFAHIYSSFKGKIW
jgi:hypothetical protein